MKKLYILSFAVIFFFGCNKLLNAQETTLFSNDFSYTQTFAHNPSPSARDYYSNFIIQEIAKSIQKRPDYTQFKVSYILMQKLIKIDSNNYKVILEIKNFAANGDIMYRGINVAKMLIPNEFDYHIKIFRKSNGNLLSEGTEIAHRVYRNIPLNGNLGYYSILELPFSDTINDAQYSISITDQKMYFNEDGKNRFIRYMAYINDYFQSDIIIGNALAKVQEIDTDNIDFLPFYNIELKEVEQTILGIESAQYPQNLALHESDPIQFLQKMGSLTQQTSQKRHLLNQQLSVLDMLFYQKGNDFMQLGKLKDAEKYYNKSLKINQFYAPAQYQLARMQFNNGMLDTSAQMTNMALLKMNPDPSTQQLLIQLGKNIYTELLNIGEKQSTEQNFNESIQTFERAKWFCTTTPGMTCTDRVNKGLAQARYGIYHSYLKVAEKAIENQRLDIAGNYINQSIIYQKKYSSEIIAPTESMNLMGELSNAYVEKGHKMNKEKKYDIALYQFSKADSLLKTYSTLTPISSLNSGIRFSRNGIYHQLVDRAKIKLENGKLNDAENACNEALNYQQKYKKDIPDKSTAMSVMSKIKKERYDIAIGTGQKKLSASENKDALQNFITARNLEKEYSFKKNDSLNILIQIAAKPVVMQKIKDGQVKAWGNKLSEARDLYQEASGDLKIYGLEKDQDLQTELNKLKDKIFSQECTNAENEYNAKLNQASKQISHGDYSSAATSYQQAINVTNASILCNIDNSFARIEKKRIKPAMEYQSIMKNVSELSARLNYTECINKLNLSSVFYTSNRIDTFGLTHPSTLNFIQNSTDVNFIFFGVEYYMNNKDYDASLILLKELMKINYPVKYTKNIQYQLGSKMAIRDKIANPSANYKINIVKYTEGEKYLKYFTKKYKKTWKKN